MACFFFQAEDGIRDIGVTGVQTCTLPIFAVDFPDTITGGLRRTVDALRGVLERTRGDLTISIRQSELARSEERRVGKECRSRWLTEQEIEIRTNFVSV